MQFLDLKTTNDQERIIALSTDLFWGKYRPLACAY